MSRGRGTSLALALALLGPAAAAAQEPGTEVGGAVEETLGLGLSRLSGFATLPDGPAAPTLEIRAEVTSTGARAVLDVEDEALGTRAAGRITGADGLLHAPLESRVAGAFRRLDRALAEPLAVFTRPVTAAPVRIVLRQRLAAGERAAAPGDKTLLITVSTGTP